MKKQLSIIAIVTALLLTIPLIAMQFTDEVNWTLSDFVVMGTLLFVTGLAYVLATRNVKNPTTKTTIAAVIGTVFFIVWAYLATGFERWLG